MLFTALSFLVHPRCKSGVKTNGSQTSDVICNDEKTNHDITTAILTQLTSLRPLKEAQTQATHTLTTPRATPQHKGTTERNGDSTNPPNTGNYIGKRSIAIFYDTILH